MFRSSPAGGEGGAKRARIGRLALIFALLFPSFAAIADEVTGSTGRNIGPVTKQPIPRFVSLKPSDTPMREGPSKDHRIRWIFKREGLPVEVIAEHEQWRRVRDSESTEGWVYFGRLSNRRTVIVLAGKDRPERDLFARESETSTVVARLQPGVIANVEACSADWCEVTVEGFKGFLKKNAVWGVYPEERVK
ncbi:MAG: SH3 domain-containing protein [Beijerinckiaceae bacterium]|nr:SH3 domain-containing protein [Beijerinckiaceae bacterium]